MALNWRVVAVGGLSLTVVLTATHRAAVGQEPSLSAFGQAFSLECVPALSDRCARKRLQEGRRLFDVETFGGNGRTCRTCHSKQTGTFAPEDALERLAADPNDPLFLHDGLDDGIAATSRITQHATVRIEIAAASCMSSLADDPARRSVDFQSRHADNHEHAGTRSAVDVQHTRARPSAAGAGSDQRPCSNTVDPTSLELDLIKDFQQQDARFFSSDALRDFPAAVHHRSSRRARRIQRGRRAMFEPGFNPETKQGVCNICHSGPMLQSVRTR